MSGFGVSTIMTPTLLLFLPFPQTILLVCIIHWFHDIWKIIFFRHGIDWNMFMFFGIPSVVGALWGALQVTQQANGLTPWLGIFLIICVVLLLFVPQLTFGYNWLNGLIGGGLSGFFAGLFGIRGAMRSLFLTAYDLRKATFIGTTGAISFMIDSVRLVTYVQQGIRLNDVLLRGLYIFVPASLVGALIGQYLLDKIPQKHFRTVVAFFLLAVGIKLIVWPWINQR